MDDVTPEAKREALARKHREAQSNRASRSTQQQARLRLLRWQGGRYARHAETPRAQPSRILVIRPDHLGDLLFATPALHLLRSQFPQATITALVGPWGRAVLASNPDVDDIAELSFPGFTRQPKGWPWAPYRLLHAEATRLAAARFDLALILRFDHWWGAWLAAASGIPQRIGYDVDEARPFLTQAVPYVRGRHEVVQNLGLVVAAAGLDNKPVAEVPAPGAVSWALRFEGSPSGRAAAGQLLEPHDAGRPFVAIHPGSGAAVKRWRTAAWVELARLLAVEHGAQVVFTGSGAEAGLIEPILAGLGDTGLQPPPISLAGQTDLNGLAEVYRRCVLVIGPDSGPLHLAVAVGTPTVHLYGPVDQRTFGPWGSPQRHRVVTSAWACIACNRLDWPDGVVADHGCVRDVTVEQVWAEVVDLLLLQGFAIRSLLR